MRFELALIGVALWVVLLTLWLGLVIHRRRHL